MKKNKNLPKGLSITKLEDKIVYTLYDTNIVTIDTRLNGYTLNSGGWKTAHTKKCMNLALESFGASVFQKKGQWYITTKINDRPHNFYDGMTIY